MSREAFHGEPQHGKDAGWQAPRVYMSREAFHGEPQRGRGAGGQAPRVYTSRPLIIGVTGGIASGKTTLAKMISGRGIAHLNADKLVHQLMKQDQDTIREIAANFPANIMKTIQGEPQIDRAGLGVHIARHPESLPRLEAILHPRIRAAELAAIDAAYRNRLRALVLDIPLLFETEADALCDIVIAAHAPLPHRKARAFARKGMTEDKWRRLLDRQLPDRFRNRMADIVITTGIGKAETRKRINHWMLLAGLR